MPSKTILITGCSANRIRAAVALALAKRSHHVFATARTISKIPEELASLPNVTVLPPDVSSPASVAAAVEAIRATGKQLDVLVNNAGIGYSMPLLDVDVERAKHVCEVNVWAVIRTVQAFADLLIQSKGRIVNVSTCSAVVNTPWICMLSLPFSSQLLASLVPRSLHASSCFRFMA
jgi:NAD(P)-dependent dehydrogenase (short-subunit alcohol dehydrogenase family)